MEQVNRQNFLQNFISNIFGTGSPNYGQSAAPNISEQAVQNQNTFSALQNNISDMRGNNATEMFNSNLQFPNGTPNFPNPAGDLPLPQSPWPSPNEHSYRPIDPGIGDGRGFNPFGFPNLRPPDGPIIPQNSIPDANPWGPVPNNFPKPFPFPNEVPGFPNGGPRRPIDPGIGDGTPLPQIPFPGFFPHIPLQLMRGISIDQALQYVEKSLDGSDEAIQNRGPQAITDPEEIKQRQQQQWEREQRDKELFPKTEVFHELDGDVVFGRSVGEKANLIRDPNIFEGDTNAKQSKRFLNNQSVSSNPWNNPIDPQIDGGPRNWNTPGFGGAAIDGGPARRDSNGNIIAGDQNVIDPRTLRQLPPLPPIHVPTITEFLGINDAESRQNFNQAEHDKPPEQRMTVDQLMGNYTRARDMAISMEGRIHDMMQNMFQGNTFQNPLNPLSENNFQGQNQLSQGGSGGEGFTNKFFASTNTNKDGLNSSQLYNKAQELFSQATAMWRDNPQQSLQIRAQGEAMMNEAMHLAEVIDNKQNNQNDNNINPLNEGSGTSSINTLKEDQTRKTEEAAKKLSAQISHEYGGMMSAKSFLRGAVPDSEINNIISSSMDRLEQAYSQLMALPDVGEVSMLKAEASQLYNAARFSA